MRPSSRIGPLAAACGLASVALPAGATVKATPEVILVEASNHPAASAATKAGHLYTFTVTGMYSYDGAVGLTDCGHKDPSGPNAWEATTNLYVDGNAAQCIVQPFTPTHTYQWVQAGTGRPFALEIVTRGGDRDDVGYLVVAVVEN